MLVVTALSFAGNKFEGASYLSAVIAPGNTSKIVSFSATPECSFHSHVSDDGRIIYRNSNVRNIFIFNRIKLSYMTGDRTQRNVLSL